jgi:hypothetical protein
MQSCWWPVLRYYPSICLKSEEDLTQEASQFHILDQCWVCPKQRTDVFLRLRLLRWQIFRLRSSGKVIPCHLVGRYQHFEETCCFHLQGLVLPSLHQFHFFPIWLTPLSYRWKQKVPPKCRWWFCGFFDNAVSISDYTESDGRMIGE